MDFYGITIAEMVGYLASLVVLISFLMKDIRSLRIVGTIGCILFTIYGFILPAISWPLIITNVAITFINSYYLLKNKN